MIKLSMSHRGYLLVVRKTHGGGCMAILPLSHRTRWSESADIVQTELKAGGLGQLSPFTGSCETPPRKPRRSP